MISSPDCLAERYRYDPNTRLPYSNAQIGEHAISEQVKSIYRDARPETRELYNLGLVGSATKEEGDNWIIRWMLWHVLRYRDHRNKHPRGDLSYHGASAEMTFQLVTPTICKTRKPFHHVYSTENP